MALYAISIAAELVGTGIQNLRAYERRGLVAPHRTPGGTRLYSANDLIRLRRITTLLSDGLNLAGVEVVLRLEDQNEALRLRLARIDPRGTMKAPAPDEKPISDL
ncbi:MerR family transcriptional regulator [Nocardioides sp.]|uniref:MerR family transcriptional regulator n=1 Tax=Nocardioides sp. TaxID=35761 RepID=UPI002617150E|nr:MerR family transcriptional regulator [Nocardioides sp.]